MKPPCGRAVAPRPPHNARIFYRDIGDYLSSEEKRKAVKELHSMLAPEMGLSSISPNEAGDWINQRDGLFESFISLESEGKFNSKSKSVFVVNSRGLETARDSWVYNSSKTSLLETTRKMVAYYNQQVELFINRKDKSVKAKDFIEYNPEKISWSSNLIESVQKGRQAVFQPESVCLGMYRPFFKQFVYRGDKFINRKGRFDQFFPTPQSRNLVICVSGANIRRPFSCLITDAIPDLHIFDEGTQCFPLYWYEKVERDQLGLFDNGRDEYKCRSGLSDFILQRTREEYGPKVTAEDVFYYVYGLLHSQEYRKRFSNNLKKGLARIPLVTTTQDFKAFVKAGRKLAELHLGYETIEPYKSLIVTGAGGRVSSSASDSAAGDSRPPEFRVAQMRFAKSNGEEDRSVILFNDAIKIENIPLRAYDWEVNGKSPIEWLLERYAVTVNKDSKICNDPNDWCREQGNPRYILDLVGRIVNVSLQTLDIIETLPKLDF